MTDCILPQPHGYFHRQHWLLQLLGTINVDKEFNILIYDTGREVTIKTERQFWTERPTCFAQGANLVMEPYQPPLCIFHGVFLKPYFSKLPEFSFTPKAYWKWNHLFAIVDANGSCVIYTRYKIMRQAIIKVWLFSVLRWKISLVLAFYTFNWRFVKRITKKIVLSVFLILALLFHPIMYFSASLTEYTFWLNLFWSVTSCSDSNGQLSSSSHHRRLANLR